ncbi:MAG: AIR synthase-related protein, partial [Pseudomonadota bacterium]
GLPASGVHSNGYSLVRKLVESEGLDWRDAAPFDDQRSIAEAFLEPTKIYVKPLLQAIRETGQIKALAHITGGGLTENIPRVLPDELGVEIDLSAWLAPPVFDWLQSVSRLDSQEFARTFNAGIGMIAVTEADASASVLKVLKQAGQEAITIGTVEKCGEGEQQVRLSGQLRFS